VQLERLPGLIRGAGPARLFPAYGLLHTIVALAGLASTVRGTFVTAFWPAAGLLLAACVACRRRQRWALLGAAVTGELAASRIYGAFTGRYQPIALTLYLAVAHAAVYSLSTVLVEKWWHVPLPAGLSKLARGSGVVALILLGGIAVTIVGLASYLDISYLALVPAALAGHMLGAMAVTPVILSWWMAQIGYRGEVVGSRIELVLVVVSALLAVALVVAWPGDAALQPFYVFFPILLWAAMRYPLRYASVLGFGMTATVIMTTVATGPSGPWSDAAMARLVSLQLYLITILTSALWVGVANYERRRSEHGLRQYARALATTEERVRRSTAADLHDGIAQDVSGLGMILAAAGKKTTDADAEQAILHSVEVLHEIANRTRHLIEELDAPWATEVDLPFAIDWLSGRLLERSGLQVEVRHLAAPPVIASQDRVLLFRCVRELLQNVIRHSGVLLATVDLRSTNGQLHVTVADEGRGFDIRFATPGQLHGGFGLFSIREQLASRGAHASIETSPGHGCAVTIVWPL
jgi:signal transduction histidine kinase